MLNRPTYRLNPQDVGQARGIGISVLFNNGTNVFNQTFTTKDQVKSKAMLDDLTLLNIGYIPSNLPSIRLFFIIHE